MTKEPLETAITRNATDDGMRQFLTFTVSDEEYGVDIMGVREIKGWTESTRLPNSPSYMRGVMNLRGIILPIFDLRARFNMEPTQPHERNVVIVLALENRNIGILVDAVSDILSVTEQDIKSKPENGDRQSQNYVTGIISMHSRMVVLLEADKLFDASAQAEIDGTQAAA